MPSSPEAFAQLCWRDGSQRRAASPWCSWWTRTATNRLKGDGRRRRLLSSSPPSVRRLVRIHLLDPFRVEGRLAGGPAGGGGGGLADRLEQHAATCRVDMRQARGGAEGARQPWWRARADQP